MSSKSSIRLSDLPDDWWRRLSTCQTLANWFGRYLVGLFFSVSLGGQPQYGVYTGFLLYHRQALLWITAGHVIDEIRGILSSPNVNITMMHWLDGYEFFGAESIPVHNRDLRMYSASSSGIDFGTIAITGLDRENMIRNERLQIMTEQGWRNLHRARPEGYYIVGYPHEWGEYRQDARSGNQIMHSFRANLACLPVSRIDYREPTRSDDEFWSDPEAFYGQILSFADGTEYQPDDIRGMSGGPLLSVERDPSNEIRYRLFGIQRSWLRDSRLIRAEPIQHIAELINL
ncbi:MAG: hypothetical protein L0332_10950 [Chloroflexi bacterium]|nr:hypothetical protein [Chloroflexota bacterium]MCI0578525.1 hypothetical protein [Chloroflexota bacterium]MCI0647185.1 hypothetical protein [Chloroflexota bacterium]MCI0727224.1 hypothetical protein [Chloroflexota bacterium]